MPSDDTAEGFPLVPQLSRLTVSAVLASTVACAVFDVANAPVTLPPENANPGGELETVAPLKNTVEAAGALPPVHLMESFSLVLAAFDTKAEHRSLFALIGETVAVPPVGAPGIDGETVHPE